MKPPLPANESARLEALERYRILDTGREQAYDDLCLLASQICGTSIAYISFISEDRQWFKSKLGFSVSETPRDIAFCAHAILESDLTVVPDVLKDRRFADNPLVVHDPKIRFYAGAPLVTFDGYSLGALCVIDLQPRTLNDREMAALRALGRQVVTQLELRRSLNELSRALAERDRAEKALSEGQQRLFQFLEAVPVGVFVVDPTGKPFYANQMSQKILGKGIAPEATSEDLADVYHVYNSVTKEEYAADRIPVVRALSGETVNVDDVEIHRGDAIVQLEVTAVPIKSTEGQIVYAIAAFYDISNRRKSERRLRTQYVVTRVLAESTTLEEASERILQSICESVGWHAGVLWNVSHEKNVLECLQVWHTPSKDVSAFETLTRKLTFPPGFGLPGRVWATAKPHWIPDVVEDTNFPRIPAALQSGLHAALSFPITLGSEVMGVIEFFSSEIQEPDTDLLAMFGSLGSQIGQFIARKRFEERQAQLLQQLETANLQLQSMKSE